MVKHGLRTLTDGALVEPEARRQFGSPLPDTDAFGMGSLFTDTKTAGPPAS